MSNFEYHLPRERIAQRHAAFGATRSSSKLLVATSAHPDTVEISDCCFEDITGLLGEKDCLILNDCIVQPARFFAKKNGIESPIEILLVRPMVDAFEVTETESTSDSVWEALARPMKKLHPEDEIRLSDGLSAKVLGRTNDERRIRIQLNRIESEGESCKSISDLIESEGNMPIPPYIREGVSDSSDKQWYQTVFAKQGRAIAAPTAGLHFTDDILDEIRAKGVSIAYLTLEVGLPSIRAVQEEEISQGKLHRERYSVPRETLQAIDAAKKSGGRIVAVGTTVVRALESFYVDGESRPDTFLDSELFIQPGFEFKVVDAMVTNFHQPRSTHLLLVSAFAGEELIRSCYKHALNGTYRFLSYGDAMFLECRK